MIAARTEVVTGTPAGSGAAKEPVSLVIPAYNEVNGAATSLTELIDTLDAKLGGIPFEIIVVDDGSTDGTHEALAPLASDRLMVLRHPHNRGYGAAIKTGVRHARYPWILITDADGTYPAEHIPALLADRDRHEMVVGARTGDEAHIPLLRRPPKWVLRKLASYLIRQPIPDLNSGLRVFRKDLAERFQNILPDRFSYTTTITLALFSSGYAVSYVPINYRRRKGTSKIRPIADTLGFLKLILRTTLYFDPLRVFLPVALLFLAAAVATGVGSWALLGTIMDVTTVLLFVTGVQLLGLGMLADMLNRRLP